MRRSNLAAPVVPRAGSRAFGRVFCKTLFVLVLASPALVLLEPACGLPLAGTGTTPVPVDAGGCPGVDLETSLANCGACGHACDTRPNMPASCNAGQCTYACSQGYVDCDGVAANGCEASLAQDPKNCGACGKSCEDATCADSKCQPVVLADNRTEPAAIAVDADRVYWTEGGNPSGAVMSITKTGQQLRAVVGAVHPNQLVVAGTNVCFTDLGSGAPSSGAVVCASKDGSGLPVTIAPGQNAPAGIASDSQRVYWAETGGGAVWSNSVGGGVPVNVAGAQDEPVNVALDDIYVYWTNKGGVSRAPLSGGGVTVLASVPTVGSRVSALALGGNWLLFTTSGPSGTLNRFARSGATAVEALATDQPFLAALVADGTNVYYTNTSSAAGRADAGASLTGAIDVKPYDRLDAVPAPVIAGQEAPVAIAQDDMHLYWVDLGSAPGKGKIWKLLK